MRRVDDYRNGRRIEPPNALTQREWFWQLTLNTGEYRSEVGDDALQ
jgi:hypothetical protein